MWWYDAKHIDHQVILLCKKYIEEQRSCKFAGQAFTCIYYHLLLLYVGGWHWLFNSLLNMDLIPKVGRRRAQSKGFSDRRRFAVIFWCWLVRKTMAIDNAKTTNANLQGSAQQPAAPDHPTVATSTAAWVKMGAAFDSKSPLWVRCCFGLPYLYRLMLNRLGAPKIWDGSY